MDFSLKRWGAHFCPPPILPAKKACFLPPFQVFGYVAHMFFRFLLHRFCVFLHDFCIFSHFFVKFSAWANANWQILGVICCVSDDHPMQISQNFPTCTVEIIQHALLYGWNYPVHPPVWLRLPNSPSCTVEITQYTLQYGWNYPAHPLYGWNYPARPERAESPSPGQRPGYKAISNAPCKGKSFKYT